MEVIVKLAKAARKSGGDKYEATGALAFNVYIPQVISRAGNGQPAEEFVVTIKERT